MPTRLGAGIGPRIVGVALFGLLYILGCHWLMTRPGGSPWNVVGVLTPMLAAVALGAWRGGQRALAALAALGIAALCAQALLGVHVPTQWLYVAQHVAVHLFLAFGFGSTLAAGQTPLITTMARRVHRSFTPEMARYTRHCTLAWTLYFIGMALASVLLYAFAPFDAWALFANLLTPLAVGLMFGAEYLLRYRVHPEFERTSLADAVRAYLQGGAEATVAASEAAPAAVAHRNTVA